MPEFTKGEKGSHEPDLLEKETTPPKMYTEASLLRAMETAGKLIKDEDLRDAMKENGIGRPSTRANIIETLFKRKYVIRQRKNLVPTATGIELIATIHNELLKSAELTGRWEKKLRQIERGDYDAKNFMDEMKTMVSELVVEVKKQHGNSITIIEEKKQKKEAPKNKTAKTAGGAITCPKCGNGNILKGKNAFGCSNYKNGCKFVVSFIQYEKKLTDKQIQTLLTKKKTATIKGFNINGEKAEGYLVLNSNFIIEFKQKSASKVQKSKEYTCPVCKKGKMLKGKQAFGCSRFKEGCKFVIPFVKLQDKFTTNELSDKILKEFAEK